MDNFCYWTCYDFVHSVDIITPKEEHFCSKLIVLLINKEKSPNLIFLLKKKKNRFRKRADILNTQTKINIATLDYQHHLVQPDHHALQVTVASFAIESQT